MFVQKIHGEIVGQKYQTSTKSRTVGQLCANVLIIIYLAEICKSSVPFADIRS